MKHNLKLLNQIFNTIKINEFDKINCDSYSCNKPTREQLLISPKLKKCPLAIYARKHGTKVRYIYCSKYYNALKLKYKELLIEKLTNDLK